MTKYLDDDTHVAINKEKSNYGVAAMRSGWVQRYHTTAELAGLQNNAEHQWRVATLLKLWCPKSVMNETLLYEALWHDAGEFVVGDLPGPSKAQYPALGAATKPIEMQARNDMGLPPAKLTDIQKKWLRFADLAECLSFTMCRRPDLMNTKEWQDTYNLAFQRGIELGLTETEMRNILGG